MAESSIEWVSGPNGEEGYTFNPWLGCAKVHAGCTHCYAEVSQAVSMRKGGPVQWGEVWQGGQRVVVSDSTWMHPFTWARAAARAGERRKVFCASLADVLEVPIEPKDYPRQWTMEQVRAASLRTAAVSFSLETARERLWPIIEDTAWVCGGCGRPCSHSSDTEHRKHRLNDLSMVGAACEGVSGRCLNTPMGGLDFLLLTKRPENAGLVPGWARPLVWLGTSISDQKTADVYVPRLLDAQGFRYRFLSCEPMVGPVDLRTLWRHRGFTKPLTGESITSSNSGPVVSQTFGPKIDWVVFGFESGKNARRGNVDWISQGLKQCAQAGVAAFVKQLGSNAGDDAGKMNWRYRNEDPSDFRVVLSHPKGGDPAEWPEDLRVRQWPDAMDVPGRRPPVSHPNASNRGRQEQ